MRITGPAHRNDLPPHAFGTRASWLAVAALLGGGAAFAATVGAAAQTTAATSYSTTQLTAGHAYRHGVVPAVAPASSKRGVAPALHATSSQNLSFDGGLDGVGVTTGHEQVYLVFWGSQWGSQGADGSGNFTYSGDPSGIAPMLQAFMKGLGTGGETWSGVMTQYCEGVSVGAQSCPSSASHVAYPSGGALAGVWEDTSAAAPGTASGHQIGVEAESAATHFGNTTTASNRDAQYVIVSPTGTNPDNYQTQGFCAWHDYNGDTTLSGGAVSGSNLAFTNLPYIPDAGFSCGAYFVSAANDGVTIVEGHEYAETITDQFPAGGWTDRSGAENGDKCAWISSGQGAAQDITLTTGSFAVQSTWANDFNNGSGGCEVSHAIVSNGNTVTVTNPGPQSSTVGSPVNLQIQASDSAAGQTLTYSATNLPAGLSISGSTGDITGTPTSNGTSSVAVKATDTTGAFGTTSFSWSVSGGNTVTVTNPGSQSSTTGSPVSLQIHASDSANGQTLTYGASGLPAGLSINSSSGLVSGTPTAAGTFSPTVTATDTTGAAGSASFSWSVKNAVKVTNPGNQTTHHGTFVSLTIRASDSGGLKLTFSASTLPRGLKINSSTGVISGTPTRTGRWTVTVTATDSTGARGTTTFTWTIT